MFDKEAIQQLKQANISIDEEKTKTRTYELWKSASKAEKEAIENLAGVARATVQRAYKTGSISAKLVVPFAQILNIDPLYLTGERDEVGACTEEGLRDLLMAKGYEKLLTGKKKRPYKRREAAPVVENEPVEELPVPVYAPAPVPAPQIEIINEQPGVTLSEDDMELLMRSITLRAKSGVLNARKQLASLQGLLLE